MSRMGAADIAAVMRREITKGTWARHDRLPASRELADSYGVARNTLRDALAQLSREGLVEIRAGSGSYVTFEAGDVSVAAIQNASPLELIDARFALEPHICRLAVLHGRREDFARLQELCERMESMVDDAAGFAETDTEFHRLLANSTRNNLLMWIIGQMNAVRGTDEWSRMRHLTLDAAIIQQYNLQHRQVLNAIRSREPERAAQMMKEHLETARLSLTRAAET